MGNIPVRRCTVDGCEDRYEAKGLCKRHYMRLLNRGTVESAFFPPEVRFLKKINKAGPIHPVLGTSCWLWEGAIGAKGYGTIWVAPKNLLTHRFSYELAYGPITDGLFVLHKCDVRACVRPDHLFLGTHKDNMADMVAKGRCSRPGTHGERNGKAKLTDQKVRDMRQLFATGQYSTAELSKRFDIPVDRVRRVVRRAAWKHV